MINKSSDAILERMLTLHPKSIDLTLDRVYRLLEALGNPHLYIPPVIHIAGTNGKGSTQAMLLAGLEAAGLRVHSYTSPHIERFHERIRLAGKLISEKYLSEILAHCYEVNKGNKITYFEITTCAAFLAMVEAKGDYTLLEVGLGGRLDATNVVEKPFLTLITPISYDHEQFLGNNITKIACEKSGIIKREVPVIVAQQEEKVLQVIKNKAAENNSEILVFGRDWNIYKRNERLFYQDIIGHLDLPMPILPGEHQIQNAGVALRSLRFLSQEKNVFDAAMTKAIWPARLQLLNEGKFAKLAGNAELWLDGGHNPAAGKALANHISSLKYKPTYLICGMLKTKNIKGYLTPLAPYSKVLYAVTIPKEPNTFTAIETSNFARSVDIVSKTSASVSTAISEIITKSPNARIIICGSLYLSGHVLRENHGSPN